MPRSNDLRIRSGTAAPAAADFNVGEPAWDTSAGRLYVKNAAGVMVEINAGGGAVASYSSPSQFPGVGAASTLYVSTSTNRVYRWSAADGYYVEVGPVGGVASSPSFLSALVFG